MILKTTLFGHTYEFKSVREVMAKANEEKSGDKLAGIAAETAEERVAAKVVLSNLTTEAIQMYNIPSVAFVRGVDQDSPAENGGICKGDIIVKFDGQKVSDGDDLLDKLQYYKSGETIEAVVARADNGEYKESIVEVTLGTRPDNN